ncbi:MAG: prolipoprotein diacylglyceryl transferase [Pirellulales bacterium]
MPGLIAFAWKFKMPVALLLDLAAPSMALGQALGRIGCFMNGCCFGGPCELPWAVTFPEQSPAFVQELENGQLYPGGVVWKFDKTTEKLNVVSVQADSPAAIVGLKPGDEITSLSLAGKSGNSQVTLPSVYRDGTAALLTPHEIGKLLSLRQADAGATLSATLAGKTEPLTWTLGPRPVQSLPIHPTQIYSAIDAFLLCGVLLCWIPFRKHHGELIALTLVLHAISRFLLEIIRTDEAGQFGTNLSISQWISIGMLATGAAIYLMVSRDPNGVVLRARQRLENVFRETRRHSTNTPRENSRGVRRRGRRTTQTHQAVGLITTKREPPAGERT